jgi:hypothetical protein
MEGGIRGGGSAGSVDQASHAIWSGTRLAVVA